MELCAIYARKSTDERDKADDAKSVARQVENARAYARAHGWHVDDRFICVDDGISGAEFRPDKRPGLTRLLTAARDRAIQILVISEPSRLGRKTIDTMMVQQQLIEAGVRIFAYLDDRALTLDDELDEIHAFISSWSSSSERRKARQRTFEALKRKAASGAVAGGRCFGYTNVRADGKTTRMINPVEEAVVVRIFTEFGQGAGLKGIAHRLNADHVPGPRGSTRGWSHMTVHAILKHSIYRGVVVWNKTSKRNAAGVKRSGIRKPESEWVTVPAPALRIVSDELWEKAQARFAHSGATYLRTKRVCRDTRRVRSSSANPNSGLLRNISSRASPFARSVAVAFRPG